MNYLAQDLRLAFRALRNDVWLTLVAVLTLGLGIGANTTIFTWLDTLVLHPLPAVRETDQLVLVETVTPGGARWSSVSYPALRDVGRDAQTLSGAAAYNVVQLRLRSDAQAERVWATEVSANYFDVLGVRPVLGRTFQPSEDAVPGDGFTAVLSYNFWQRRFAGDSGIVGRTLILNGHPIVVVGIAPPHFGGTIVGLQFDLFVPISLDPVLSGNHTRLADRGVRSFNAFARLRPGASIGQARRELRVLGDRFAATYVDDRSTSLTAAPFGSDGPQAWFGPALFALMGITGVVLLVACANVANLMLARATARQREMGTRLALGARRGRLVRQLLCESLLLSVLGGALALAVAAWGTDVISALVPSAPLPINVVMRLDGRVLAFTLAITVGTTLLFGVVPALHASNPNLVPALKDDPGARGAGRGRLRGALVVAQVALSLVALASAGLFFRSLQRAQSMDLGFRDPGHVLLVSTDMNLAGYAPSAAQQFYRQLIAHVAVLPGVKSVSLVRNAPLGFGGASANAARVEGYDSRRDENMPIAFELAGPGYFKTMQTPILDGRDIAVHDDSGAPRIAVVNEAFARRFWPGQRAIGRRIDLGDGWRTVVGIVATGKYRQVAEQPLPFVFIPVAQEYSATVTLLVRTASDPRGLVEPLRRTFASLDENVPFLDVRTLREHIGAAVFIQRVAAIMLGLFGALALCLATMGTYSVMAYVVSQRTRELGLRSALGAGRKNIVGLVLGRGMRLTALGILFGVLAALGAGVVLRTQLVGVSPADPLVLVGISLILGAASLLASWVPARRAARINPMVAMRTS